MAKGEGVYIPVNLQIAEAQKQADALVKKLAKTKVDLAVSTQDVERAQKLFDASVEARSRANKAWSSLVKKDKKTNSFVPREGVSQGQVDEARARYDEAVEENNRLYEALQKAKAEQDKINDSVTESERRYEALQERIAQLNVEQEMSGDEFWEAFSKAIDNYNRGAEERTKEVLDNVSQSKTVFLGLGDAIRSIGEALPAVFGGLVGALDKATQKAGELGVVLTKKVAVGFLEAGKKLNPFKNALEGFHKISGKAGKFLQEVLENDSLSLLTRLARSLRDVIDNNAQLSASFSALRGAIQSAFAPIATWAIPILAQLLNFLTAVINTIARFTAGLFGMTAKQAQANAKALDKQAQATGGVAKETKKATASIDELNTLNDSAGGGGGGGAGGTGLSFTDDVFNFEEKMQTLGGDIATAINDAVAGVDWRALGEYLGNWLALMIHVAWDFVTTMDWSAVGFAFAQMMNGIISMQNPVEIGELLWGIVQSGFDVLLGFIAGFDVAQFVNQLMLVASSVASAFANYISNIDWGMLANKIYEFLYTFLTNENWGQIAKDILLGLVEGLFGFVVLVFDAFSAIGSAIVEWVLRLFGIHSPSTVFADIGKQLLEGLIAGAKGMWQTVIQTFTNLWSTIKNIFAVVRDWFRQTFNNAMTALTGAISGAVEKVRTASQTIWNTIKNVFSTVAEWFRAKFQNAWTNVKNVFSSGGQVFKGITDGISATFKRIVNSLIGGINNVVAFPFNAINNALDRIRNINIAGMYPFYGKIPRISVPQIPYLAQGTVVPPNRQFMAMLGDNKTETEVVSPLSTMKEALAEALAESGGQHVVVNIDGRQLFDIVVNQNNSEVRRTGMTPLLT